MSCCCCSNYPSDDEDPGAEMQDTAQGKDTSEPTPYMTVKRKNRSCTDIICLLLFLVCLGGLGVVFYFAVTTGDPYTLIYPTDSRGNLCGHSNETKDLKHLVFFDMMECLRMGPIAIVSGGCPTPQVCVEKCPKVNWAWMELWLQEANGGAAAATRKSNMICDYGDPQNDTTLSVADLVRQRSCAPYYLNSTSIAGRCIPSVLKRGAELAKTILTKSGQEIRSADNLTEISYGNIANASSYLSIFLSSVTVAQNIFQDVVESRFLIIAGIGIGAALAFIWCLLLRCFAAIIVYGSLFLFTVSFLVAALYCFWTYLMDSSLKSFNDALGVNYFTTNFSVYLRLQETWLGLGILASVILLIVLVLIIFLRKRLQLAIALIRESSKAIAAIPASLLFPLWPLIFQVCVIVLFAANAALLASSGKKEFATTNSTTGESTECKLSDENYLGCQFVRYGGNNWTYYLQAFNIFMGFWISAFIVSLAELVLAGSFASYYWAWDKSKDIPTCPIVLSLWHAVRYHLGTVAFGSLLIAIVRFIRACLSYLESKLKDRSNVLLKFLFCCLKCFFWCLEKFLKFLSKEAYIVTAINGKNFCAAAKQAFSIILSNCVRYAVVDNVTSFVLFVSKLLVTAMITAVSVLFFQGKLSFNSYIQSFEVQLNYFFVPVILIGLSTWIICCLFFSVFDFAVDTMLLCAMVDSNKNDGSKEKPYFMSRNLMKILDVRNRFSESNASK